MTYSDAIFLSLPVVLGFGTSAIFTNGKGPECQTVVSSLKPPAWVFVVAWAILYILLGVSCMLLWQKGKRVLTDALVLNLIVVTLLVAYWIIFANLCAPLASFICICTLVAFVLGVTLVHLKKNNWGAGMLLVPLVLWLSFAAYLTYTGV